MGILTIINYIAIGIGYIILTLMLIFSLWLLIDFVKEKYQSKKRERENAEKENARPQGAATDTAASSSGTEQTTTSAHTEKKEELIENKEKLIDESGKIKMLS